MQRGFLALLAGLVFGAGLTVSGMVNPAKVLNFLDVFGQWDPSLLLVMGGAVVVTFIGYRLSWRRRSPAFAKAFLIPTRTDFDRRLISGAALFGAGWGLAGFCPGPALSAMIIAGEPAVYFVAAMAVGMVLADVLFVPTKAR